MIEGKIIKGANRLKVSAHLVPVFLMLITSFFSWSFNNIVIALSFVYSIHFFRKDFNPSRRDVFFLLPVLLFFAYLVGLIWSDNPQNAFKQVEKRSLLLIFPVIFFLVRRRFTNEDITKTLHLFVYICTVLSFVCYITAAINIYVNDSFKVAGEWERNYYYYSYIFFTNAVNIDPIYLSLLVNFSLVILLYKPVKMVRVNIMLFLNLVVFNFLISSKIGLIGMVLVFILFLFTIFRNRFLSLIAVFILVGISFYAVTKSPFLKERFFTSMDYNFEAEYSGEWNSISQRLAIWDCAIKALREVFPAGYGTADGQTGLNAIYTEKKYVRGLEDQYNAHNEYLYTMLDLGLPGIATLLIILIIPLGFTVKHNQLVFLSFIVLLLLFFLVEVVLNRRIGVTFFAFFYCLMVIDFLKIKERNLAHEI